MSSFHEVAEIYEQRARIPFDGSTYQERVAIDIEALGPLQQNNRIVDVGCGRGWHLLELARRGQRNLWGVDASAASLERAVEVLGSEVGRSIHLVHGDITRWGAREFFDVALCFLACFGSCSVSADRAFATSIRQMLSGSGRFVATLFDRDGASELVGRFLVSYCASSDEKVHTEVSYDTEERRLVIAQSHPVLGVLLIERLYLYSRDEVRLLLSDVGFKDVETDTLVSAGASNGLMRVTAFVGD